jgi:hypothetical protein
MQPPTVAKTIPMGACDTRDGRMSYRHIRTSRTGVGLAETDQQGLPSWDLAASATGGARLWGSHESYDTQVLLPRDWDIPESHRLLKECGARLGNGSRPNQSDAEGRANRKRVPARYMFAPALIGWVEPSGPPPAWYSAP